MLLLMALEALDMKMDHELFLKAWDDAHSVTEASLLLQRAGYPRMTPRRTWEWARCLRTFGVPLKRMPRGKLPPLRDINWLKV
jgi:hypothetical protein